VKNNAQEQTADLQAAVVFHKACFLEFVHEVEKSSSLMPIAASRVLQGMIETDGGARRAGELPLVPHCYSRERL
jgi:hypothetical protein